MVDVEDQDEVFYGGISTIKNLAAQQERNSVGPWCGGDLKASAVGMEWGFTSFLQSHVFSWNQPCLLEILTGDCKVFLRMCGRGKKRSRLVDQDWETEYFFTIFLQFNDIVCRPSCYFEIPCLKGDPVATIFSVCHKHSQQVVSRHGQSMGTFKENALRQGNSIDTS